MFTAAARRDVYKFLLNPDEPGEPRATHTEQHLGAALLAKSSGRAPSTPLDTLAFVDRSALPSGPLPAGWTLLDDATLLRALDHLGETEPLPLAALGALEKFLARKAAAWGDAHVRRLSVEFLVCFGRELTPRLDVNHRIRSVALTDVELATLSTTPFAKYVDATVLRGYQRMVEASPTAALSTPPVPAQELVTMPGALSQPASPRMPALPALPPARSSPAAASNAAHAQLFSKA